MIACTASSMEASKRLTPGRTDIVIDPGLNARTLGTGKRPAHHSNTAASRACSGVEPDFSIHDAVDSQKAHDFSAAFSDQNRCATRSVLHLGMIARQANRGKT